MKRTNLKEFVKSKIYRPFNSFSHEIDPDYCAYSVHEQGRGRWI